MAKRKGSSPIRIITVIILLIGVVIIGFALWGGESGNTPHSVTGIRHSETQNYNDSFSPCAAPVEITALPGVWTSIPMRWTCSWELIDSLLHGGTLQNAQACVSLKATPENGDEVILKHGLCPSGNEAAHFDPNVPLRSVAIRSEEIYVVYRTVRYLRHR